MSLNPEHWRGRASVLARRDPRWRLAAFVGAVLLIAFLRDIGPSLAALGIALGSMLLGRVPWAYLKPRLLLLAVALLPFALVVPFTVPRGDVLWSWQRVQLTDVGLLVTGVLLLKTLTITLLMLTLLASAPLPTTLEAAGKLGVPRLFVQLVLLTYRYVFVLLEELNRLRIALRVRAFRNRLNPHSLRTIGQVTGTLLVRGSDHAERVAHAMRCRGFDGRFRSRHVYHTRWPDVLLFGVLLGSTVALLVWDGQP